VNAAGFRIARLRLHAGWGPYQIRWVEHLAPEIPRTPYGSNQQWGVEVSEVVAETPDQHFDEPPIQGPEARQREELQMLLIGFGTGLTVAGVFLIYVVLDIAKLL
jgi:hypothetical protein